ncbi:MAG: hypothetical protein ACYC2H_00425 [Thermoplasmatota archaeon]
MRSVAVASCLFLVLAGCVGTDRFDEARPGDWQRGVVLEAFESTTDHDADETYTLRPANATTVPTPIRCVAYQDGRHARGDECEVLGPGRVDYAGIAEPQWTIEAAWDGRGQRLNEDVERHPEARTVVAFDASGTVVAHWDGRLHDPDGSYSTE